MNTGQPFFTNSSRRIFTLAQVSAERATVASRGAEQDRLFADDDDNAVDWNAGDVASKAGLSDGAVIDVDAPVLPAYAVNLDGIIRWRVWCKHCHAWHYHGPMEGHRESHCHDPTRKSWGVRHPVKPPIFSERVRRLSPAVARRSASTRARCAKLTNKKSGGTTIFFLGWGGVSDLCLQTQAANLRRCAPPPRATAVDRDVSNPPNHLGEAKLFSPLNSSAIVR